MSLPTLPTLPLLASVASLSDVNPAGPSTNPDFGSLTKPMVDKPAVSLSGPLSLIFGSLDLSRTVAVVLGLILIAGGILLFRPVRDTIVETAKTAGRAAAA